MCICVDRMCLLVVCLLREVRMLVGILTLIDTLTLIDAIGTDPPECSGELWLSVERPTRSRGVLTLLYWKNSPEWSSLYLLDEY